MPEENTGQEVTQEEGSLDSFTDQFSTFKDPFDYDNEGPGDPLSDIEFQMGDDGEIQLVGVQSPDDNEQSIKEEEKGDQKAAEDTGEDVSGGATEPAQTIPNPFSQEAQGQLNPQLQQYLQTQQQKIDSLEKKLAERETKETVSEKRSAQRAKLEEAGFLDDQIDAILEITEPGDIEDDSSPETEEDLEKAKELYQGNIAAEASQVMRIYNGQQGKPNTIQMRPFVNYTYQRFGDQAVNAPIPAVFRVAENAPFIRYLDEKFPERTSQMNMAQIFQESEKVRQQYYEQQNKPAHSYDHIIDMEKIIEQSENGEQTEEQNNVEDTQLSNDVVNRLAGEKQRRSRGVPGGEVETEAEIKERSRPKSAREVATQAVLAHLGQ